MSSNSRITFPGFLVFLLFLTMTVLANELSDGNQKLGIKGYAYWQFGQIVKGHDRDINNAPGIIENAWQNGVLIGLMFNARPNEHLDLVISPEFYLNYAYPQIPKDAASARPLGTTYINEAYGKFLFGDTENPFLQAKLGMFAFKYNPDGRNFGDYLFRTGTYPTWLITNFDFPATRLLGLQLSSDPVNVEHTINLHADILFTSEAFIFPFGDFSLTGIISSKFFDAIELGAGIDFARFLPVTDSLTTPKWIVGNGPSGPFSNLYFTPQGDTGFYSFKATKVMTRAAIDPKPFFGSPKWLGTEDLKIYGEVCWVGVGGYNENPVEVIDSLNQFTYRPWYKNLNERTPRMIGFNFPAFRLLDVLSLELEHFPSLYPNDYRNQIISRSPVPYFDQGLGQYENTKGEWDNGAWRWSIYARKMIVNGFSITGEAAFDHLRTTNIDGSTKEYECLYKKGHWHWNAKFSYAF